jgi:hypothetical protein
MNSKKQSKMNTNYPSESEINEIELIRQEASAHNMLFEIDFNAAKLETEGYTSIEAYRMSYGKQIK